MIRSVDQGRMFAEAWKAAQQSHAEMLAAVQSSLPEPLRSAGPEGAAGAFESSLGSAVGRGIDALQAGAGTVERLPEKIVTGEVRDFHEIAGQLKRSELTFKFALEVRNKLIDAYREVMRMSV